MTKNTTKINVSLKVLIITRGLLFIYAVVSEHFELVCFHVLADVFIYQGNVLHAHLSFSTISITENT
jgi:hypothetical protein